MKTNFHRLTVLLLVSLALGGCASGLKYDDISGSFAPVLSNQGRIYVYRTATYGAAVQPAVRLNGEVIGKAKPKGFFYVDRPPGTYEISTSTETKRSLSLNLEAGDERYVRLEVKMGLFVGHIKPVLVDNAVGQKGIKKTRYTGE